MDAFFPVGLYSSKYKCIILDKFKNAMYRLCTVPIKSVSISCWFPFHLFIVKMPKLQRLHFRGRAFSIGKWLTTVECVPS